MFKQLDHRDDRILSLRITGEISDEEHRLIDLLLRHYISQVGRISVLVQVKPYPSLNSAEALFEDLRMMKLHADHIDKLALVCDRAQDRTYLGLFGLFGRMKTDFFLPGQFEEARQWLKS